jgi:hypothetical protein
MDRPRGSLIWINAVVKTAGNPYATQPFSSPRDVFLSYVNVFPRQKVFL